MKILAFFPVKTISFFVLMLVVVVIRAIYQGFWWGTRSELDNEEEKNIFLQSKFDYLRDYKFDKKTLISTDPELARIQNLLKKNGFKKKGVISDVQCHLPHSNKKPWKVFMTVKSGSWPFTNREEEIQIYSITDRELSESVDFLNHIKEIQPQ